MSLVARSHTGSPHFALLSLIPEDCNQDAEKHPDREFDVNSHISPAPQRFAHKQYRQRPYRRESR
jgi:hypothetical protein